jgi:hypothetical protein
MFYFKFKKTMEKWLKNSRKGMAMLAAVAFMLVAGWQFGVSGKEAVFSGTEVALEKAVANSGGPGADVSCKDVPNPGSGDYQARICVKDGNAYCEWDYYDIFGPQTNGTCHF